MIRPLLLALLCSLALPAAAQTHQFADIGYTPLDGWTPGRERDGSKVFLSDLPGDRCASCRFYLSASEPHRGTITDYLAQNLTRFEDRPDRFVPLGAAKTLALAGHRAELAAFAYGTRKLYVFTTVDLNGRKALLTFRSSYDDQQELMAQLDVFGDQIAPYFNSLRFGASVLPPAEPGQMSGIWWSWHQGMTMGLDGMAITQLRQRRLVFFPDGHVYAGTPPQGTAGVDRTAAIQDFDKNLGVYRQHGNRLSLTFLDGRQEDLTLTRDGLSDGAHSYAQVTPLSDGARLEGTLTEFSYAALGTGGAGQSRDLRFYADGRFEGKTVGTATSAALLHSRSTPQRGHYRVQDGLLVMTDAQGTLTSDLIYETDHGVMIGSAYFEGTTQ